MKEIEKYLYLFDLSPDYDKSDLKKSYRTLSKVWHPDLHHKNPEMKSIAEEKFKRINEGYIYLKKQVEAKDEDNFGYEYSGSGKYTNRKSESHKNSDNFYNNKRTNDNKETKGPEYSGRNTNRSDEFHTDYENKYQNPDNKFSIGRVPRVLFFIIIVFIFFGSIYNYLTNEAYDSYDSSIKMQSKESTGSRSLDSGNQYSSGQDSESYVAMYYYERAKELKEENKLQDAKARLDRALEIDPNLTEAYSARGFIKYELWENWYRNLSQETGNLESSYGYEAAFAYNSQVKDELGFTNNSICEDLRKGNDLNFDKLPVLRRLCS